MKRIPELQPLSMEHHLSLSLAVKAMRTARSDDAAAKQVLCKQIVDEYASRWRPHFDAEEHCLFAPFGDRSPEIRALCDRLAAEHRQFDAWAEQMRRGDCSALEAFGELLQTHTRLEERELFEALSHQLTEQELEQVGRCLGADTVTA
jgi:hemerythrin-like domain-containing protein